MKRTLIALTCVVMFAGLAKAQEQEPFDYPQSWEETKESAPKDLELVVCSRNPYFNLVLLGNSDPKQTPTTSGGSHSIPMKHGY